MYETRASLLRTYQNPVDADPLWQMPRFTKEVKCFVKKKLKYEHTNEEFWRRYLANHHWLGSLYSSGNGISTVCSNDLVGNT